MGFSSGVRLPSAASGRRSCSRGAWRRGEAIRPRCPALLSSPALLMRCPAGDPTASGGAGPPRFQVGPVRTRLHGPRHPYRVTCPAAARRTGACLGHQSQLWSIWLQAPSQPNSASSRSFAANVLSNPRLDVGAPGVAETAGAAGTPHTVSTSPKRASHLLKKT